jgi:hypothetical protein
MEQQTSGMNPRAARAASSSVAVITGAGSVAPPISSMAATIAARPHACFDMVPPK